MVISYTEVKEEVESDKSKLNKIGIAFALLLLIYCGVLSELTESELSEDLLWYISLQKY